MTAISSSTEFVQRSGEHMAAAGWNPGYVLFPGGQVLLGTKAKFRLRWLATRLQTFVVLAEFPQAPPNVGPQALDGLLDDAVTYAIASHSGPMRGLQSGVAIIAIAVGHGWSPGERDWAAKPRRRRFAAMTMPVIADVADGQVLRPERAFIGFIYQSYLRSVVADFVQQPMNELRGGR